MSLGQLSVAPTNQIELTEFSFANQDEHIKAAKAIANSSKYQNQNLLVRPLDPIPFDDERAMGEWLNNHYDMHSAINSALGIDGSDLTTVDFHNPAQLSAWSLLHFSEHQQWQQLLNMT